LINGEKSKVDVFLDFCNFICVVFCFISI